MQDGSQDAVLPRRSSFSTTDPDQAREFMAATCPGKTVGPLGDLTGFKFFAGEIVSGPLRMAWFRQRAGSRTVTEPIDHVLVIRPLADHAVLGPPDDPVRVPAGVPMLAPQRKPLLALWRGLCCDTVQFATAQVVRLATESTGIRPEEFAFTGAFPVSYETGRHWSITAGFVAREVLGVPEIASNPLIVGQAMRMLVATTLATFPNTTMAHDPTIDATAEPRNGRDDASPAVVRRAVDFIEAHAREDLTLTRIAEAARIGPRGLAYAFRRHLDTTPMAYVRKVRLEGAHRDLRAADPTRGDTVAAIARAWGFANVGRFARVYRLAYGRLPSHTLRA